MKDAFKIGIGFIAGATLAGIWFATFQHKNFRFITAQNGNVLWICNQKTGDAQSMSINSPVATTPFELWKGNLYDYLLNKQSGETWRFFKNDTNSYPDEGFAPLAHIRPQSLLTDAQVGITNGYNIITNEAQKSR